MRTEIAAKAFKAWAQRNNLIGNEFPVDLGVDSDERDVLFDALKITAAGERTLRTRHLLSIGFNEAERKIVVLTSKKVIARDSHVLPQEIGDDISVVYLHAGVAQVGPPPAGVPNSPYYIYNERYACGSSIHPARVLGAGTLGCLVKDTNGTLYGLTNNHVSGLCSYSLLGEKILAPGHIDVTASGIDPFTIGHHYKNLPMVPGVPDNVDISINQDAALVSILNENCVSSMQGLYYDTPQSVFQLQAGLDVEKVGRTTGHTYGKVVAQTVGAFPVNYSVAGIGSQIAYFEPVFIVQGSAGQPFSSSGDSGSLVVSMVGGERRAVGVVFAGDSQGFSYILPLEPILNNLSVSLVSGLNV